MFRARLVLAVLLLTPVAAAAQQTEFLLATPELSPEMQRPMGERSPTLAGLLSWLVWPGVGSYYAGNSGHGTRHVVISVVSLGPAIALLATCDNDGFCDFDNDGTRLTATIGLAAVYVGNAVWSIITAVNDAEDRNYRIRSGEMALTPTIRQLATRLPDGRRASRLGVQIVSLRF